MSSATLLQIRVRLLGTIGVLASLTAGVSVAKAIDDEQRVLSFPKDRAVGVISYRSADGSDFGFESNPYVDWGDEGEATGDVVIPADQHVRLEISKAASTDLSFLSDLNPNDIEYLGLRGTDVDDKQLKHVGTLTGLRYLNLQSTRISDGGVRHLKDLNKLQTLDLSAFSVERDGYGVGNAAMIIAARLPSLEALRLRLTKVTDGGMENIAKSKSLKSLSVPGTKVTDAGLAHLRSLKTLTALTLGVYDEGCEVTDDGMKHVGEMTQLEWLQLNGTPVSDEGLAHLSKLTRLKSLDIEGTNVSNEGLRHFAPFTSLIRCRIYDLDDGDLRDHGAAHLAKVPSLERITAHFRLTDEGVANIATMPNLQSLSLNGDGQRISDAAIEAVSKMKRLKDLDLIECNIDGDSLQHLQCHPTIESLSISRRGLEGESLHVLRTMPFLKTLRVNYGRERNRKWQPILTPLGELTNLTRLSIRGEGIDLKQLRVLSKLTNLEHLEVDEELILDDEAFGHLAKLTSLTSLRIGASVVTDAGLKQISALSKLEYLTISCLATDGGLSALKPLKTLRMLQMASPSTTDEGLNNLSEKMPSLQDVNHFTYRVDLSKVPDALVEESVEEECGLQNDGGDEAATEPQHSIRLIIVGPDGKSVPNANVEIRSNPRVTAGQVMVGSHKKDGSYGNYFTASASGELQVSFTKLPGNFNVSIHHPGFGPYWARWQGSSQPGVLPKDFTIELEGGWSVGGVITDNDGNPIADVEVHPSIEYKKNPGDNSQLGVGARAKTDENGRWRFDKVPVSKKEVFVEISHPEFKPLRRSLPRDGFGIALDETPSTQIELDRGLVITGTVTDESGEPIDGAVIKTEMVNDLRSTRSGKDGTYQLSGLEERLSRIVIHADGMAMDMKEMHIAPDMEPLNFVMKPGGKIRIRVIDENGNGVHRSRIFFQRWRGRIKYFEFDHVQQYTDRNGIWEWDEAPLDEFAADITRPGGMQLDEQKLLAGQDEYVFLPPKSLVISGSVVDKKTRKPVPSFKVMPGLRNSNPRRGINWVRRDAYDAANGKYRITFDENAVGHIVRIEAEGYKVAQSRDFKSTDGAVEYNFELLPAENITATLLTDDGELAVGAKVALGIKGSSIYVDNGVLRDSSRSAGKFVSNEEGQFSFSDRDEDFHIVVTHAAGFAHLKSTDSSIPEYITLTPWAKLDGQFFIGKTPQANVKLSMSGGGPTSYDDDGPSIYSRHFITTGKEGRFAFDRVYPGKSRIGRNISISVEDGAQRATSSSKVPVHFESGKTTKLQLGGRGREVIGQLRPPKDNAEKVLWKFATISVRADIRPPQPEEAPKEIQEDPATYQAWWEAWLTTTQGKQWSQQYQEYERMREEFPYITATAGHDGRFKITDVQAGKYVLSVRFGRRDMGGRGNVQFSVPRDEQETPIDLGSVQLE